MLALRRAFNPESRNRLFPYPGCSLHLSFGRGRFFWAGQQRTTADFSTFTLGAGSLNAGGLIAAADTSIVLTVAALGLTSPGPGAVLFAASQISLPATNRRFLEFHDDTANNRITWLQSTAGGFTPVIVTAGATEASIAGGTLYNGLRSAGIISFSTNSCKAALNGKAATEDVLVNLPTVTKLTLASGVPASSQCTAALLEVVGWDRAFSQAECNDMSALFCLA